MTKLWKVGVRNSDLLWKRKWWTNTRKSGYI